MPLRVSVGDVGLGCGLLVHAVEVGAGFHQFVQMIENRESAVPSLESTRIAIHEASHAMIAVVQGLGLAIVWALVTSALWR